MSIYYWKKMMSIEAVNARNQFRGEIIEIISGPVVSEVVVGTQSGAVSICLSKYSVRINGMATNLKNTEFRLLHFFMLNNGNVLSREAILRKVWRGNVVVGERTVDVHILKLRKVLARHGIADSIQTIRGIGYRSCFSRVNPSLLITS